MAEPRAHLGLIRRRWLAPLALLALVAAAGAAAGTAGDFYAKGTRQCAGTYAGHSGLSGYGDPIDINADGGDLGRRVYAPEDGSVSVYSNSDSHWAGFSIIWTSANGKEKIHVAHLKDIVKTGTVKAGDLVAHAGNTGNVIGGGPDQAAHLHISRRYNNAPADVVLSGINLNNRVTNSVDYCYHSAGPVVNPDTTDPETTPTLTGTPGNNGWWKSDVTVKLTATDSGSGVDRIVWRLDLGSWRTYTGPFTLVADGHRRVDYYAVDNAGNVETTETITVKVDNNPPSTTHAFTGTAGLNGWFRSPVTVALAATDATSGVARTTGTRDGAAFTYGGPFTVSGEGSHALTYRSEDVAGNVEATRSAALRIDTVAPATTMALGGPSYQGAQLYVSGATRFTLAATDATSGVRATSWTWRGATQGYAGAFGLGGPDGASTLAWRSEDHAGNAEASRSAALFLDNTPPSLALTAGPAPGAILASLEPVAVGAEASDAGSGVARVEFLVDGVLRFADTAAPYAWAWAVGDEALGDHVLTVRAVDRLGHAASVQRAVSTVPTSAAGAQATAARAQGVALATAADATTLAQGPPPSPGQVQAFAGRALDRAAVFTPDAPVLTVPPAPPALPAAPAVPALPLEAAEPPGVDAHAPALPDLD